MPLSRSSRDRQESSSHVALDEQRSTIVDLRAPDKSLNSSTVYPPRSRAGGPYASSRFKQMQQRSYYTDYNFFSVTLFLNLVVVIFIPLGTLTLVSSARIFHKDVRYDNVRQCTYNSNDGLVSFEVPGYPPVMQGCRVVVNFTLTQRVRGPVLFQYRIKNFLQNYRPYSQSKDDSQLRGLVAENYAGYCRPFTYPGQFRGSDSNIADGRAYRDYTYNPCGSIAHSVFNDSLRLYLQKDNGSLENVCIGDAFDAHGNPIGDAGRCTKKGIALEVDKESRFRPPLKRSDQWTGEGAGTDPYRSKGWYAYEPGHKIPLSTDEDFMVWSRLSTFSDFRKLYRKINGDLEAGTYTLEIDEYFDVSSFDGEKHAVLETQTWLGARHLVLGSLLTAIGGFAFILGLAIIMSHIFTESRRAI